MRNTLTPHHILLVDDDEKWSDSLKDVLELRNYEVTVVGDGDLALDLLEKRKFDAVLTDFDMPTLNGLELLEMAQKKAYQRYRAPIIFMTGHSTTGLAIEATKKGADDYLTKPFEMPELFAILEKAVQTSRLTSRKVRYEDSESDFADDVIVGNSRAMRKVYQQIGMFAPLSIPVVIVGETGTGKELVARALFQHSDRSKKPFIAINCARLSDSEIELELFGREQGLNSRLHRIGRFEQANGGTLFLDEVGDLSLNVQATLLRAIESQCFRRVGGKNEVSVDVRVIATTNRNLEQMITEGTFREDLFFRLNASRINLPSLSEKLDDLEPLCQYLVTRHSEHLGIDPVPAISPEVLRLLATYSWPGNVRELENILRLALLDSRGFPLTGEIISPLLKHADSRSDGPLKSGSPEMGVQPLLWGQRIQNRLDEAQITDSDDETASPSVGAYETLLRDLEIELFSRAVQLCHGNQSQMARYLGLSRLTVREKLDKYDLYPNRGG